MAWGQGKGRKSPLVARILSFIIPGLGHIYATQFVEGIIWFLISIPFLLLAIYCYRWQQNLKKIITPYPYFSRMGRFGRFDLLDIPFVLYILYLIGCANSSANAVITYNVAQQEKEIAHQANHRLE